MLPLKGHHFSVWWGLRLDFRGVRAQQAREASFPS
jgi:hypothetical protein